MEATIDQVLAVLAFSHYYIIERLRQRSSEAEFKDLLEKLLIKHQEQLSQQYEVLCLATVRTERGLIFTYETQTNVRSGVVNVYENNVAVRSYSMGQVQEVHAVAIYHKAMPFEDIVALSKEKRTPQGKKFHNKLFDQALEVSKSETLTNPSPNPAPTSCFNTPVRKTAPDANSREFSSGRSSAIISRKLMLVSDSEEEGEEVEKKEEKDKDKAGIPEERKARENIIIQKLRQNQYGRLLQGSQSPFRPQERTEKKTSAADAAEPPLPHNQSTSKKSRRQQEVEARAEQRKREVERQSTFMKNWLGKVRIDK